MTKKAHMYLRKMKDRKNWQYWAAGRDADKFSASSWSTLYNAHVKESNGWRSVRCNSSSYWTRNQSGWMLESIKKAQKDKDQTIAVMPLELFS